MIGLAGLVQNSPNDEHKEALVLLAASEDLINCVIVVVTNSIIDIIEDVEVEGEPPAKVTWFFKGQDQSKKEDVVVSNPDYATSIVINNAKRIQSGMYLIRWAIEIFVN